MSKRSGLFVIHSLYLKKRPARCKIHKIHEMSIKSLEQTDNPSLIHRPQEIWHQIVDTGCGNRRIKSQSSVITSFREWIRQRRVINRIKSLTVIDNWSISVTKNRLERRPLGISRPILSLFEADWSETSWEARNLPLRITESPSYVKAMNKDGPERK
jgi:hypothetical protein